FWVNKVCHWLNSAIRVPLALALFEGGVLALLLPFKSIKLKGRRFNRAIGVLPKTSNALL
ncbi:MAG: hypothetical protein AAB680_05930, partial [Pseudomonadota bacterium]